MDHPPSWTRVWCHRHRRTMSLTAVCPSWSHHVAWWASPQGMGARQPGQRQPRSRAWRALRIQWGAGREARGRGPPGAGGGGVLETRGGGGGGGGAGGGGWRGGGGGGGG